MNDILVLIEGVFGVLAVTGMLSVMIDRQLRAWKINMTDISFATLIPAFAATVVEAIMGGFDSPNAALYFALMFGAFAYFNLPAIAVRRVERFERNLRFKGASALNAEQARKRLRLVVPFIFNPFVGFFLMKLLFAKGKMIYGNRSPLRGMELGVELDLDGQEVFNPLTGSLVMDNTGFDIDGNIYIPPKKSKSDRK